MHAHDTEAPSLRYPKRVIVHESGSAYSGGRAWACDVVTGNESADSLMIVELLVDAAALLGAACCRGWIHPRRASLRRSAELWKAWGTLRAAPPLRGTYGLTRKEAIVWMLHALALAAAVAVATTTPTSNGTPTIEVATWMMAALATSGAALLLVRAASVWSMWPSARWLPTVPVAAGLMVVAVASSSRGFAAADGSPATAAIAAAIPVLAPVWYAGGIAFLVGLPFLDARLNRRWSSGLFAYAVPRELVLLGGGAVLPYASHFLPYSAGLVTSGLGLFAVAATAWRQGQITRLRALPFVVLIAGVGLGGADRTPATNAAALAYGHLTIALVYLVHAFAALERARAYSEPEPLSSEQRSSEASTFEAGGVTIGVIHRSTPDTEGATVTVQGTVGKSRVEALRFDCFEIDPHLHYDPSGRDEQRPMATSPGEDMVAWITARLENELPRMLNEASFAALAAKLDEARVREQLPAIRAAIRAAFRG